MATALSYGASEFVESLAAAYEGRLQRSRQASIQAVSLARQGHLQERAALFEGAAAIREALYGYPDESSRPLTRCASVRSRARRGLSSGVRLRLIRAFIGGSAHHHAAEKQYPEDSCIRFTYSPALRALLALNQGRPAKAIELLTVSKPYELAQTGVSYVDRPDGFVPQGRVHPARQP